MTLTGHQVQNQASTGQVLPNQSLCSNQDIKSNRQIHFQYCQKPECSHHSNRTSSPNYYQDIQSKNYQANAVSALPTTECSHHSTGHFVQLSTGQIHFSIARKQSHLTQTGHHVQTNPGNIIDVSNKNVWLHIFQQNFKNCNK